MKAFFVLKPDALERKEVIKAYQNIIGTQDYIKNRQQYLIKSWVDLSCMLYEPSYRITNKEELIKLRQQLLTTIKCYDYLYKDKSGIVDIFDVPNDMEVLKKLEKIKYLIRKQYVLETDKNYLKFLDLPSNTLSNCLVDIPVRNLNISHIKVGCNDFVNINGYNLAYLNCIHISDPDIESIERDLNAMETTKSLVKKINL